MLPPEIGNQEIVRLRGTAAPDTHKNPIITWTSPASLTIGGCSVQGQLGTENLNGRDSVTWVFRLFAPFDADVTAKDRILFDGVTYEVDGPVVPMHDPTGTGMDHKMAKLRLVQG